MNIVFQSYHLMVSIGMLLILLSASGVFFWWRGTLFEKRWLLWIFVPAVLLPQAGNQLGWISAEVGRQPWIVYGVMKTSDAVSPIATSQVAVTLLAFIVVYGLLGLVGFYLIA